MSVGSAFDAYVKADLHEKIYGKGADPEYERDALFVTQVEEHNRDWALGAGQHAMDQYVTSGAYADLLKDLEQAAGDIKFESTIRGDVGGVTLLGKPDLSYQAKSGRYVILDWKVNGFCGRRPTSPKKGYMQIRDGWKDDAPSRICNQAHKDAMPFTLDGFKINCAHTLDMINKDWGRQLSTYAWLLGAPVGGEFIVAIDQLACVPTYKPYPNIRVAEFRGIIRPDYQHELLKQYQDLLALIESGWIFRDISEEESHRRQETLDRQHLAFQGEFGDLVHELSQRGGY